MLPAMLYRSPGQELLDKTMSSAKWNFKWTACSLIPSTMQMSPHTWLWSHLSRLGSRLTGMFRLRIQKKLRYIPYNLFQYSQWSTLNCSVNDSRFQSSEGNIFVVQKLNEIKNVTINSDCNVEHEITPNDTFYRTADSEKEYGDYNVNQELKALPQVRFLLSFLFMIISNNLFSYWL